MEHWRTYRILIGLLIIASFMRDVPTEIQQEAANRINRQDNLITYTEEMPAIGLVIQDEHQTTKSSLSGRNSSSVG